MEEDYEYHEYLDGDGLHKCHLCEFIETNIIMEKLDEFGRAAPLVAQMAMLGEYYVVCHTLEDIRAFHWHIKDLMNAGYKPKGGLAVGETRNGKPYWAKVMLRDSQVYFEALENEVTSSSEAKPE